MTLCCQIMDSKIDLKLPLLKLALWPVALLNCIVASEAPIIPKELVYPQEECKISPALEAQNAQVAPLSPSPLALAKNNHPLVEIIENVYNNSPKLLSARLQLAIEKSRSQQLRSQLFPSLDLVGNQDSAQERYERIEDSSHPTKFGAVLSQPLFNRPLQLAHRIAAYDETLAVIQSKIQNEEIVLELCRRYLDLYRFARLAEFSRNNTGLANEHLRSTKIRQEKGELTITDTHQALVRYKTAQAINEQSKTQLDIAKIRFSELSQAPAPEKPLLFMLALSEEEMLSFMQPETLRMQPELSMISTRIHKEELQNSMANSRYLPRLDLRLEQFRTWNNNSSSIGSPYDETRLSVNFNWNLFSSGLTHAQQEESQLVQQQLRLNYSQQELESQRMVQEAIMNIQVSTKLGEAYKEAVDAAIKALKGIQQEFLVGTRTALDAFDAQNELFVSQTRWLNAKVDRLSSSLLLLKTIGKMELEHFCIRLGIDKSLDG